MGDVGTVAPTVSHCLRAQRQVAYLGTSLAVLWQQGCCFSRGGRSRRPCLVWGCGGADAVPSLAGSLREVAGVLRLPALPVPSTSLSPFPPGSGGVRTPRGEGGEAGGPPVPSFPRLRSGLRGGNVLKDLRSSVLASEDSLPALPGREEGWSQ